MKSLRIEGLTKIYGNGLGVREIDIEVDAGEVVGFIGKNGAGKSTTIRAALGLLRPSRGRALLLGRDPVEQPSVRAHVGYVPSEPGVYEGMGVGAMLEYLGAFYDRSRPIAARRKELCEIFDLDTGREATELSFGNRKKVALVAALQHSPPILVLDEPTAGLDPLIQSRLFEVLREEQRRGAAIFFSSHVLAEVERVCDRFAILRDGRIVQQGRLGELQIECARQVRATIPRPRAVLALADVASLERNGDEIRFLYEGELPSLLEALLADEATSLQIEKPSLEELVMHHYGVGLEATRSNGIPANVSMSPAEVSHV